MIYEVAEASSPISQGDIFTGIPCVELPPDCLSVFLEGDVPQSLKWEEFASNGAAVSALLAVRPTIAIVGSQDCDAVRAPDLTLFEVKPFRDVEGKCRYTNRPHGWQSIIVQHSKVNQKWFYLPPENNIGFSEKMAVDFDISLRVPRLAVQHLKRLGRLNEQARAHFRERLSEYFRRYSFDEWYSLTAEEFADYRKTRPAAEPYPWQR